MRTWYSDRPPPEIAITPAGRVRAALRLVALGAVVFGGLGVLLSLRLVERPLCGGRRPATATLTRGVCRAALVIIGLRLHREGRPMRGAGAMVANHSSWLDIFVLNACTPLFFLAKAEVAGWPAIGFLARAAGTMFVVRDRRAAPEQRAAMARRLRLGHRLLFFPEGTSSDGRRVLPFRSTLFGAFFVDGLDRGIRLQPVSVVYDAPLGADPRVYGWWGDMDFAPHLVAVLAKARRGSVTVVFHDPVPVSEAGDRKTLCAWAEAAVRAGHSARLSGPADPDAGREQG